MQEGMQRRWGFSTSSPSARGRQSLCSHVDSGCGTGDVAGAWFLEQGVLNASGGSRILWSFPRQMSPS